MNSDAAIRERLINRALDLDHSLALLKIRLEQIIDDSRTEENKGDLVEKIRKAITQ